VSCSGFAGNGSALCTITAPTSQSRINQDTRVFEYLKEPSLALICYQNDTCVLCNLDLTVCGPLVFNSACSTVKAIKPLVFIDTMYYNVSLAIKCEDKVAKVYRFTQQFYSGHPFTQDQQFNLVEEATINFEDRDRLELLGWMNSRKLLMLAAQSDACQETIYFYEKTPCNPNCLTCSNTNASFCLTCDAGMTPVIGVCPPPFYCGTKAVSSCSSCGTSSFVKNATINLNKRTIAADGKLMNGKLRSPSSGEWRSADLQFVHRSRLLQEPHFDAQHLPALPLRLLELHKPPEQQLSQLQRVVLPHPVPPPRSLHRDLPRRHDSEHRNLHLRCWTGLPLFVPELHRHAGTPLHLVSRWKGTPPELDGQPHLQHHHELPHRLLQHHDHNHFAPEQRDRVRSVHSQKLPGVLKRNELHDVFSRLLQLSWLLHGVLGLQLQNLQLYEHHFVQRMLRELLLLIAEQLLHRLPTAEREIAVFRDRHLHSPHSGQLPNRQRVRLFEVLDLQHRLLRARADRRVHRLQCCRLLQLHEHD